MPAPAVAIADHEIPTRAPLRLAVGDAVTVGRRDTEWPAFVFVTCPAGSGWVPERHLSVDGTGTVIAPYDTTELPVRAGETVVVVIEDRPSGWSWCRNDAGAEGWVPSNKLGPPNPTAERW